MVSMKQVSKILPFIPLGMDLLLISVVFPKKLAGIAWIPHLPITILLAVIGIGIVSRKRIIKQTGNAALIVLTAVLCIMGYYDYIQWFSTIVGVVIFMYFIIIKIVVKKLKIVQD